MTSDPRPDLVDKTALDQVRGNISPPVVAELYEQFITELKNHGMLDETGATVPPDRLSRRAHSLKSTCGTFGLARLAWLARQIELACRDDKLTEAENLVREFESEVVHSVEALREALQN